VKGILKDKGKFLMAPVARAFVRLGVTAEALTLTGLVTAGVAGTLFATGHLRLGALLVLVAGILDSADGTVARLRGSVRPIGAFIDSVIDRYCEAIIFSGLLIHYLRLENHGLAFLTFAAMVGAFLVSYMRARLEGLGRECRVGLLEREDRVIVLAAGGFFGETGVHVALWILAVLSHFTALQRMWYATRVLKD
jgi:CDP-diacylglycerol--glycerol-3-phosphate 3-phosphatidyltransferase